MRAHNTTVPRLNRPNRTLPGHVATALGLALLAAQPASAQVTIARVSDVTRLQGQGTNTLMGYGLVTGLSGTGDGAKFLPTMRALAATLQRFGALVESVEDIQAAKNAAVVMIEVIIPEHGAREGDMLDVQVTAIAAKSLEGGRLLPTPLVYHDRGVEGLFGFAQGPISVDTAIKTGGSIRDGGRVERDVLINVLASGQELRAAGLHNPWIQEGQSYVTLVLDDAHAGWSMAAAIAQAIDKELTVSAGVDRVALAADPRNVIVLLPEHQRGDPASWIRDVEKTAILMEPNEARVTINRSAGTIVITGDTKLSPVVVSQLGMTVTVAGSAGGAGRQGSGEDQDYVALDTEKGRMPSVNDLLEALNRLHVPFKDRVSILEQIHRAGKLHARLMYEG